jgi:hypothetical protein
MADTHEFGPESLIHRIPVQVETTPAPDCSTCSRYADLLIYLDTGEGPFEMSETRRKRLAEIIQRIPHEAALSVLLVNAGVCPFGMLRDQIFDGKSYPATTLGEVKERVPLGSCVTFDAKYRPGRDVNADLLGD